MVYELPGSHGARNPEALEAYRSFLSLLDGGELWVRWSYFGYLDRLARPQGFPVGTCPYDEGEEGQMQCVLSTFADLIGEPQSPNALQLTKRTPFSTTEMWHFRQTIDGIPVIGGGVKVVLDLEGNIVTVSSNLIPDLEVDMGPSYSSAAQCLEAFNESRGLDNVEAALGEEAEITKLDDRIWVDRESQSHRGVPVKSGMALTRGSGRSWSLLLDGASGSVVRLREYIDTAWDDIDLNTYARHRSIYLADTCVSPDTCDYGECSDHFSPEQCVYPCTADGHCTNSWDDGVCETDGSSEWNGYCGLPWDDIGGGAPLDLYYTDDWEVSVYDNHYGYLRVQVALEHLVGLHTDMGFTGWDAQDSPPNYCVDLLYNRKGGSTTMGECSVPASANFMGYDGGGRCVLYCSWVTEIGATTRATSDRHQTLAHEFGHWLEANQLGYGNQPPEGLSEGIPDLFGAILSSMYANSEPWDGTCLARSAGADYGQDGWRNKYCGKDPCCRTEIPYTHRSYYDYLPCDATNAVGTTDCTYNATASACEPYEMCLNATTGEKCASGDSGCKCGVNGDVHNNMGVWQRFIRIYADGSASLGPNETGGYSGPDDSDEDIDASGANFSGVGWLCAAKVVWRALSSLDEEEGLDDWIGHLKYASLLVGLYDDDCDDFAYGQETYTQLARALEAAGFPHRRWEVGAMDDVAVYSGLASAAYWSGWSDGYKYFWAYVDDADGKVKVRYEYDSNEQTKVLSSANNYIGRPVIDLYQDRIYVFWTTSSYGVKYYYLEDDDTNVWHGPYDVSAASPEGAVAVAADDDGGIALVFTKRGIPDLHKVCITRCTDSDSDTICEEAEWDTMVCNDDHATSRSIQALPELDAVWARNVNGVELDEADDPSLYVFSSDLTTSALRVSRGYFDGSDFYWRIEAAAIPSTNPYPSSTSRSSLGITWKRAAFTNLDANGKYLNHLYLVWQNGYLQNDMWIGSDNKYVSVVQNLGEETPGDRWFTLPADQMLEWSATRPYLSFLKGYPWDHLYGIVYTSSSGELYLEENYYRY